MRAVDAIMECLKAEGVDHVFGIPGGANLPTYDALYDAGVRHVQCRHEQGAGHATALCWVSGHGEIGPGVGTGPEDLVPVVLAALDRVAKMQEPESFGVSCTTASWWLMDRLRRLGFRVHWPGWIMSSVPLPGLDRYVPTRPITLL